MPEPVGVRSDAFIDDALSVQLVGRLVGWWLHNKKNMTARVLVCVRDCSVLCAAQR